MTVETGKMNIEKHGHNITKRTYKDGKNINVKTVERKYIRSGNMGVKMSKKFN
jgi:hypothetical protein